MITLREEVLLRYGLSSESLNVGELKEIVRRLPRGANLIYDGDKRVFRLCSQRSEER